MDGSLAVVHLLHIRLHSSSPGCLRSTTLSLSLLSSGLQLWWWSWHPYAAHAQSSAIAFCALQDVFGLTWWTGNMSVPLQFASLYDGQEVFCVPIACWIFALTSSLVTWSLYEMHSNVRQHLISMVRIVCSSAEGPWFTSMKEEGCDKGAHQSYLYLGTDRKGLVVPYLFKICKCYCRLCYPEEYLRLGTLVGYNWAQVLEACDCLKHLPVYFDLLVDAAVAVCHQLDLLSTDLHAVACGDLSRRSTNFASSSFSPLLLPLVWRVLFKVHRSLLLCFSLWQKRGGYSLGFSHGILLWSSEGLSLLVSWCFKPNQPQRIISGLKETLIKRYIDERTNKAEIRPEAQSEKAESCRKNLWNEIQLKGP